MSLFSVPMDLPNLQAALRDCDGESAQSRWVAAMALGRVEGDDAARAMEALMGLMADGVGEVRAQALESLCEQIRSHTPVEADRLAPYFSDDAEVVRCTAVSNASVLHEDPESVAVTALGDVSGSVRATAARVLGEMGAAAHADLLVPLLGDPDAFVRGQAAISLGLFGRGEGVSILGKLLKGDEQDAVEGAVALGTVGGPDAIRVLEARHRSWMCPVAIKAMIGAALLRCGERSGRDTLENLLSSSRDVSVMAAVQALLALPDPSLVPNLARLVAGRDPLHASSAILALAEIGRGNPETVAATLRELRGRLETTVADEVDDLLAQLEGER